MKITLEKNTEGGKNLVKDGETCICPRRGHMILVKQLSNEQIIRYFPCNSLCPLFVLNEPNIQIKCGGTIADYKVQ